MRSLNQQKTHGTRVLLLSTLLGVGLIGCGDDALETLDTPATSCRDDLPAVGFALADGYCAVAELELAGHDTAALALQGGSLLSFRQAPTIEGDSAVVFTVERQPISFAEGTLGAAEQLLRIDAALPEQEQLFGGGYLAPSGRDSVTVGYTRASDFGGSVVTGGATSTGEELAAPGNYDAAWLDTRTLLVHGTGLGEAAQGAGVYVWRDDADPRLLVDGLGDASSYLAVGSEVVYIGESAWPNNRIYAFTQAALSEAVAAGAALSKDAGTLVYEGPAADMATMGDDLAVLDVSYDAEFNAVFNGVHRIAVTVDGSSVSVGERSDLITPIEGADAVPQQLASDGPLLGVVRFTDEGKGVTIVRLK